MRIVAAKPPDFKEIFRAQVLRRPQKQKRATAKSLAPRGDWLRGWITHPFQTSGVGL